MWIMTPLGFFSINCASNKDRTPHPDLMMIRARSKAHLSNLRRAHPGLPKILTNKETDYPYRILAPRYMVAGVVLTLLTEARYTNFKSEAHRVSPQDKKYHDFLMDVWVSGLYIAPKGDAEHTAPNKTWRAVRDAVDVEMRSAVKRGRREKQ